MRVGGSRCAMSSPIMSGNALRTLARGTAAANALKLGVITPAADPLAFNAAFNALSGLGGLDIVIRLLVPLRPSLPYFLFILSHTPFKPRFLALFLASAWNVCSR